MSEEKEQKEREFLLFTRVPFLEGLLLLLKPVSSLIAILLRKFFSYTTRSLSVGTRTGYKLYSLNSLNDKPDLLFEKGETHDYHDSNAACPSSCDNYVVSFFHVKMAAKCVSLRDYSPVV